MGKFIKSQLILFVLTIGLGLPVFSSVVVWDNGSGDNLWSTPANWNTNAIPTVADDVVFNGLSNTPCAINNSVAIRSLILNGTFTNTVFLNPGFDLSITSGVSIVSGTLNAGPNRITVQGDWIVLGPSGKFEAGSSTITFSGAAPQNLNPGATNFHSLEINKTDNMLTALAPLEIRMNFVLAGGTFNPGGFEHSFYGDWTETGGTFQASGGTIAFRGSAWQNVWTLSSNYFWNILMDKSGGRILPQSNLDINGSLTLKSGQFDFRNNIYTVAGNIMEEAGATYGFFPNAIVEMDGTLPQIIGGSAVLYSLPTLRINSMNSVTPLKSLHLHDSAGLGGDFVFQKGLFNGGNLTHIIDGGWNHTGGTFNKGTSTISFQSTISPQTISAALDPFSTLRVSNTSGFQVNVDTPLVADRLVVDNGIIKFQDHGGNLKNLIQQRIVVNNGTLLIADSTVTVLTGYGLDVLGGNFEMDLGGRLEVSTLTATGSSTIRLSDSLFTGPPTLTGPLGGYLRIFADSTIDISSAIIDGINVNGFEVGPSATITNFSSVTFLNQEPGGSALTWQPNTGGPYNLNNIFFGSGSDTNINANAITIPFITFQNAAGPGAGSALENDVNNRVAWNPDPNSGGTSLNPTAFSVSSQSITYSWMSNPGSQYTLALSTDSAFNVVEATGTLSVLTTIYYNLTPETTYYFRVKISTESDLSFNLNQISTMTKTAAFGGTSLHPHFISVSSNSLSVMWDFVLSANYVVVLATDSLIDPSNTVSSGPMTGLSTSYSNLLPNTTYFFTVKVSTENNTSYPLNLRSTQTLNAGFSGTTLGPQLVSATSNALSFQWDNLGVTYVTALSLNPGFNPTLSSGPTTSNSTTYLNLNPNTSYHHRVKIATEPDTAYNYTFATTSPSSFSNSPTLLHPRVLASGLDFINASWDMIPGVFYTAVLSTDPAFATLAASETITFNNRDYFGLTSGTTYYFKVKISTENVFESVISTTTDAGGAGGGDHALNFTGANNERVSVPHHSSFDLANGQTRTIEFWFRRNFVNALTQHILSYDNSSKSAGWAFVLQAGGQVRFEPMSLGGGIGTIDPIMDTAWHHVALVRQANGFSEIYLDGVLKDSRNTNIPVLHTSPLKFGNSDDLANDFNGVIDEVRIWDTARTSSEILNNMTQHLTGNEIGLIAYWDFDDGAGQTLTNLSSQFGGVMDGSLGPDLSSFEDPMWVFDPIPGFGAPVDSTPPTIHIQHPLDATTQTMASLSTLSGTAQDNKNVNLVRFRLQRQKDNYYWIRSGQYWTPPPTNQDDPLLWNATDGLNAWTIPGYQIFWSTGNYSLNVKVEDPNFNLAIATTTFTIDTSTDSIAPTVGFLFPVNNSTYTALQLTQLSGTANDNEALSNVAVKLIRNSDGLEWDNFSVSWVSSLGPTSHFNAGLGNPALNNWSVTFPFSAWSSSGTYSVIAAARDVAENLTTSTITIMVEIQGGTGRETTDNVPPTVNIIHPASGTSHPPSTIEPLYGTAFDNVSLVEVALTLQDLSTLRYWDGTQFGPVTEVWLVQTAPTAWNYGKISWIDGRSYRLTARAKDSNANVGFQTVDFSVDSGQTGDTIPPSVNIVSPADGGVFSPTAISIHGTAGDNVSLQDVNITLRNNDSLLYYDGVGFNSGAPVPLFVNGLSVWDFSVPPVAFSNGTYQLVAIATDTAGLTTSNQVNFTISGVSSTSDTNPPAVTISFPVNSISYSDPSVLTHLYGTSIDGEGPVDEVAIALKDDNNMYWDGSGWNSASELWLLTHNIPETWESFPPILAWKNGIFEMRARARDLANNVVYSTINFTVTGQTGSGNADSQPPNSFITNPIPLAHDQPYAFTNLNGHADDPFGVSEVLISLEDNTTGKFWNGAGFTAVSEFFLNPSVSFSDAHAMDWFINIPFTAYTDGIYVFNVRAKDPTGNTAVTVTTFTVFGAGSNAGDFTPPQLSITFPQNGATYTSATLSRLSGTASDNSLQHIEVRVKNIATGENWDGSQWIPSAVWLGATGTSAWEFDAPLAMWTDGDFQFIVQAFDTAGNSSIQNSSFTIAGSGTAGIPPTVAIRFPVNGQLYTPDTLISISGTAADDGILNRVKLRLTDLNTQSDWDPSTFFWIPTQSGLWFDGVMSGNNWSTNQLPPWPGGHYQIMALAEDSTGLISIADQIDFFIDSGFSGGTGGAGGDFISPQAINDLAAKTGTLDGSVILTWTAPGDDGSVGIAQGYSIKYRSGAPITTESDWIDAFDTSFPPLNQPPPVPSPGGTKESLIISNLIPGVAYFWNVRSRDEQGNRSGLSNSELAVAFGGCSAGAGDGEGLVAIAPASSFPVESQTSSTVTFTVGASGMTQGGEISIGVPFNWKSPQIITAGDAGYVSATASNGSASLGVTISGPRIVVELLSGTLNTGDEIRVNYLAYPLCGANSTGQFFVESQSGSCGVPTAISAQASVTVIGSAADYVGFDPLEKAVPLNEVTSFSIEGQACGALASAGSDLPIVVEAVIDQNGSWVSDPNAQLSLSSDLSNVFKTRTLTLAAGQSAITLYYQLTAKSNAGESYVRISYPDLHVSGATSSNFLRIIPVSGTGLTNLSVDTGNPGTKTSVTITPNGDGVDDIAFINFDPGDNFIPWRVEVSKDGFASIPFDAGGMGRPARIAWDGRRSFFNDIAAGGTYVVRVTAAGQQNTRLSITIPATGLSGRVVDNSDNSAIANAFINIFGPVSRFTQTDSNGQFSLVGLPAGPYTLQLNPFNYTPYSLAITVTNSAQDLGEIRINPLAKVVFEGIRTNTSFEIWGAIRARGGGEELYATVHFAQGRTSPDDGFSTANPELLLRSGVVYDITADIPGFSLTPIKRTLSVGEISHWQVDLTEKVGLSGQILLPNGVLNTNGIPVFLDAGLDSDSNGSFDKGVPDFHTDSYIPPAEFQASYSFPGLDAGTYLVEAYADGFVPQSTILTIADTTQTADFTLSEGGSLIVRAQFAGDTSALDDTGSGTFPLTFRVVASNGSSVSKTVEVATHPSSTLGQFNFKGVPDGTYTLYPTPVTGFKLNPPGPKTVTVTGGSGSTTLTFSPFTGTLKATVNLPSSSSLANLIVSLVKGNLTFTAPQINGQEITFSNLEGGSYIFSALDPATESSQVTEVRIIDNQTTTISIDLAPSEVFSVTGNVRTTASPPYHNLSSIVNNSSPTTLYTTNGTQSFSALRVEAYLVQPDNTIASLPTLSGTLLDPAKIRFGPVNATDGSYQITGLRKDISYRLRLNTDFDNDQKADIPLEETIVTLRSNKTGVNFTIHDGATLNGTVTAPATDNGHALTITLTDTQLKQVVRSVAVSLVGTDASFSFPNLRVGSYLLRAEDSESPAKYAAKPIFVSLDSVAQTKTVTITLTRGAVVRGKLADRSGQLIRADNASLILPEDFKIRLVSKGHKTEASGPSSDGTFTANILPDVNYVLRIKPPNTKTANSIGKSFLPVTRQVKANVGQYFDWGVIVLESGTSVKGTVHDTHGNALTDIPLSTYQSLAREADPISVTTDDQGSFMFEDLDPRIRFYDFIANPTGGTDSLPEWSQGERTMIDITKPADIKDISLILKPLTGGISGILVSSAGSELIAGFGQYEGLPGVTILVTNRRTRKIFKFKTEPDGTFTIPLESDVYDIEFIAQSHKPYRKEKIALTNEIFDLGTLQLSAGVNLTGTLRNADGSLPTTEQVDQLIAIDSNRVQYRANLVEETITGTVNTYTFYGLTAGLHTIAAIDKQGRNRVLKDSFDVPNQDSTLDLEFTVTEPQLVASFLQKLPNGVESIFSCNQPFRNNPDDLDGNGTADDDEFQNFVTVTKGNGTLAFDSVGADRQKANYTYTSGNEAGISALQLSANFTTEETNPETGTNFTVSGTFSHPFGLASQQEDIVSSLGGEFVLPGGSGFSLPPNWSDDADLTGTLVRFQAADALTTLTGSTASNATLGAKAIAIANKLGAAAYPPRMYRAIKALADAPEVSPFSSFYDIFLPASVSRVFTNKPSLTLTYDDGADPNQINVYYFNESQNIYTLENNDRRVDSVNHTITVSIGHASVFTVLESSSPAIRGTSFAGELSVFNFPNPFNLKSKTVTLQSVSGSASRTIEGTMIKISVPADVTGALEIQIFNVAGQLVRTLRSSIPTGGTHNYVEWNGQNDMGIKVASGIYIARMTIGGANEKFFKMAVIK